MDEPITAKRFPWGVLLTVALLAAVVTLAYRPQNEADYWPVVGLAIVAGAAAFLAGRWLLGSLWGLILALTLVLHPLYTRAGLPLNALAAEVLKLITLAGVIFAWRCLFTPRPRVVMLLITGGVLLLAGTLAWPTSLREEGSHAGLVTVVVSLMGLLLASCLVFLRRKQSSTNRRRTVAGVLAGLLALLVPLGGVFLAVPVSQGIIGLKNQGMDGVARVFPGPVPDMQALQTLLENTSRPQWRQPTLPGFGEERTDWGWPLFWVVLPLLLFGLARTVWRGGVQFSRRQPPVAWLLTLFALAVILSYLMFPFYLKNDLLLLPLATLAVLLSFFGIADWIFGIGERIRLAPPDEDQEESLTQ